METNNTNDHRRSAKILAIRAAAGNPLTQCPICGRSAGAPFRHYEQGKVKFGCVDAFHTAALVGIVCESSSWHFSQAGQKMRLEELKWLKSF